MSDEPLFLVDTTHERELLAIDIDARLPHDLHFGFVERLAQLVASVPETPGWSVSRSEWSTGPVIEDGGEVGMTARVRVYESPWRGTEV